MLTPLKLQKDDLIRDHYGVYLFDVNNFYIKHHGIIPNRMSFNGISSLRIDEFLKSSDENYYFYKGVGDKWYYSPTFKVCFQYWSETCYTFYVHPDYFIEGDYQDKVKEFEKQLLKHCSPKASKNIPILNIVTVMNGGLTTIQKELVKQKDFSIEKHYNDDFQEVNKTILKRLNTIGDKGLILLHGEMGTGKSQYLKYLCANIKKKKVLFLTQAVASRIADPDMLSFFLNYKDSVVIIEDAEQILQNTTNKRSSAVSNILNVADGLLSDVLNMQMVFTFNAHRETIDKALLRKGRCIAEYKFEKLSLEKSKSLYPAATVPMTLADIFNPEEVQYVKEERKIGFYN